MSVTLDDLRTRMRDHRVVILDVLAPDIYANGHIPGAINIPLGEQAVRLLRERGYSHVEHFADGIFGWQDAGLPLESVKGSSALEASQVDLVPPPPASRTDRWHGMVDLFERRSTAALVIFWFGTIGACAVLYWLISASSMGGLREGDH